MDLKQFSALLDQYGSNWENWPEQQRIAARSLAESDSQARSLFNSQLQLDSLLFELPLPDTANLASRIATQKLRPRKTSALDILIDWLVPRQMPELWRPAVAACMPLLFGAVLANFFSFGVTEQQVAAENWNEELYVLALNDYVEAL